LHPAAFPAGVPAFFLMAFSDPGDAWLDPFCGSGSTLVAAERTGRAGRGIEVLPKYVAVTLERLAAMGLEPRKAPE
jgi:DNA modification methylase